MENTIQAGSVGQSALHQVNNKREEQENDLDNTKLKNSKKLEILDSISINLSLEKKDILDVNNDKGFLATSKTIIRNIDDGIEKLKDLNASFTSLDATHKERIDILHKASEIVKEVESTIKNTHFNNKFIASSTSHGIGSNQISIDSNDKAKSNLENIESIDQAITSLTRSKEKIQEKINILNDFIQQEESFSDLNDKNSISPKDLEAIQRDLRDRNDLFSISHKIVNEKIANLFF